MIKQSILITTGFNKNENANDEPNSVDLEANLLH